MKHFSRRQIYFKNLLVSYLAKLPKNSIEFTNGSSSVASWFLGPKAENQDFFEELLLEALHVNVEDRNQQYPNDPIYITDYRMDTDYEESLSHIRRDFRELLDELKGSVPFYSYRYQAHMNWDLSMPGMLGYFAAMLYNQNNVALEASPVTSRIERAVGDDLCQMLGYTITDGKNSSEDITSWGHLTCDGSVANMEALWAARNLKYYPVSLVQAILNEPELIVAQEMTVEYRNELRVLTEMDDWELLNIKIDEILKLPERIQADYSISEDVLNQSVEPYLIQTTGILEFYNRFLKEIEVPVVFGTATKHYSWPKNSAALGIGKDHFIDVAVDGDARMSIDDLKARLIDLWEKPENKESHKCPVLMVVVVLGSTEQSAVDPLDEVLNLRNEYRKNGYEFAVHVDSAWGGYFASLLRGEAQKEPLITNNDLDKQIVPALSMSKYVTDQYRVLPEADTITIDPHKAGYIPYPAGALCYRNKVMRNQIAFLASEVCHGDDLDADMGIYGVEGSKPGAAAAAVYMSHKIIRPNRTGYGKLLGQALFNSKRFFAGVITMAEDDDPFIVVPVQKIPAERGESVSQKEVVEQLRYIKDEIVAKQNNELLRNRKAMDLLKELGSDQIIITYGFNYKNKDGSWNSDPVKANSFMHELFTRLSFNPDKQAEQPGLIVTTSEFDPESYGHDFVNNYMARLKLVFTEPITMNFISSTTMCPWLTATEQGNFIPQLITEFRKVILQLIADLQQDPSVLSINLNEAVL